MKLSWNEIIWIYMKFIWMKSYSQPSWPYVFLNLIKLETSFILTLGPWPFLEHLFWKIYDCKFFLFPLKMHTSLLPTNWNLVELWKTPRFLALGGEEFNLEPVRRLDCSELLCNKVLLKYKRDRKSFWHRHQKGADRVPLC